MKKLLCLVLATVMLFGLVGCASQPSESAGDPAASQSEAEEAAVSNETENAEQKGVELYPEIAYGPLEGKTEDDYRFGFSFGGIADYANPVEGMANLAASELGISNIKIQTPQNWIQNEQNQMLDGMIASGIKGIFMMPSEATAGNEQITKMVDAGIPIVCMGGPPDLPSKCTMTLATDVYQCAYDATVEVIKAMGEKGNIVGLSGALNDTNTQKRFSGIEDAVAQYPDVELLQLVGDISNAESSMTIVGDLLAARGNEIDGLVAMDYYAAFAVANYMMKSDDYNHIKAVGIDSDDKVIEAIKSGKMLGTMSQNPWAQAYLSMYTLKMLVDGWTYKDGQPEVVDSGSYLITQDRADDYEDMVIEETMKIMETWTDRFNPPVK